MTLGVHSHHIQLSIRCRYLKLWSGMQYALSQLARLADLTGSDPST